MPKMQFNELASINIWPNRFVVISEVNGKVSIAQKLFVLDQNQKPFSVFLKNAILCTPDKALEIAHKIIETVGNLSVEKKDAGSMGS